MLSVTETAIANVKEFLNQEKIEPSVRIFMMSGGYSRPSLNIAPDETRENDLTFEQDGISFLVETGVVEICGAITVDFRDSGSGYGCSGGYFSISSKNPLAGAGDGCGCSCTSDSCC